MASKVATAVFSQFRTLKFLTLKKKDNLAPGDASVFTIPLNFLTFYINLWMIGSWFATIQGLLSRWLNWKSSTSTVEMEQVSVPIPIVWETINEESDDSQTTVKYDGYETTIDIVSNTKRRKLRNMRRRKRRRLNNKLQN